MAEVCPLCGENLEPGGAARRAGWKVCTHHRILIMASKYETRCNECMGRIMIGEEILLWKDGEGGSWVVLHKKERCKGAVNFVDNAPAGPWATLYLVPGAPTEVVKAAYRALAQKYHPDHGGDTAKMQALNAAMGKLVKS